MIDNASKVCNIFNNYKYFMIELQYYDCFVSILIKNGGLDCTK